ncbi:hypothetical protein DFA_10778 [Cavenderia fasciculata]|uniref:Uncharacterized protein n=1 Tax=Cavenderia fasciculata TaxID=261658 RepID=F4QBD3_CACFS|nr:uncharacterized protein DFA_10778 [Cavenderia fasciculata]EGG14905.1 hypothetical protein DFA_10778 [Cavenderia fasciculata]|eukprot:XP_004351421.1 hypothetical protein DFA_10778 [Cavenderia fasciculata]
MSHYYHTTPIVRGSATPTLSGTPTFIGGGLTSSNTPTPTLLSSDPTSTTSTSTTPTTSTPSSSTTPTLTNQHLPPSTVLVPDLSNVKDFKSVLSRHLAAHQQDWPVLLGKIFGSDPRGIIRICTEDEVPELLHLLNHKSDVFRFLMSHFSSNMNSYNFPMDRVPKSIIQKLYSNQLLTPKILEGWDTIDKTRFITVNIFQLYFFAFGLFGDYWKPNGSSSRSVFGVPTISISSNNLNKSSSSSTPSRSQPSSDRQKVIYHKLLVDYLNYFFPLGGQVNYESIDQSLCFFKILCECYLGHNITNLLISKSPNIKSLLDTFKKPTSFNLEATLLMLSHFQKFIKYCTNGQYSIYNNYNYNNIKILSPTENDNNNSNNNNNNNNNSGSKNNSPTPTSPKQTNINIGFLNQAYDIIRYPLFVYLVSYFEKFDISDNSLPTEYVTRLWINYLTPWRHNSQLEKQKSSSFFSSFQGNNNNQDQQKSISENFIIENYYMYSYVFSNFIFRALFSLDLSQENNFNTLKKILDFFMDTPLLQCLQSIDKHDRFLMKQTQGEALSSEIILCLEKQLIYYGIIENQERFSMFSNSMSQYVNALIQNLFKKQNVPIKYKEYIYQKLSLIYIIEEPKIQEIANELRSRTNKTTTTTPTESHQQPPQQHEIVQLKQLGYIVSPKRNQDGTLTDEGRRQLQKGIRTCNPIFDQYQYPISHLENRPITSEELGLPIKLAYYYSDNHQIRIYCNLFINWIDCFLYLY